MPVPIDIRLALCARLGLICDQAEVPSSPIAGMVDEPAVIDISDESDCDHIDKRRRCVTSAMKDDAEIKENLLIAQREHAYAQLYAAAVPAEWERRRLHDPPAIVRLLPSAPTGETLITIPTHHIGVGTRFIILYRHSPNNKSTMWVRFWEPPSGGPSNWADSKTTWANVEYYRSAGYIPDTVQVNVHQVTLKCVLDYNFFRKVEYYKFFGVPVFSHVDLVAGRVPANMQTQIIPAIFAPSQSVLCARKEYLDIQF